ncbi:MAG: AMP-binding protein [Marmoricola sp.]
MTDTIPGLLESALTRDPGATWLRTDDGTATFGSASAHVTRLVERLTESGVRRGDLVVVTTRTTPPYVLCWLALATIGAVTVSTDPGGTVDELAGLLGQVRPNAVITDSGLREQVESASATASSDALMLDIDDLLEDWRIELPPTTIPVSDVGPDDVAALIPTSGTTGRSKLVMQTHRAYAMAAEGFPWWMELTSDDRLMTSLPLFHINAPTYSVLGSLAVGAGLVLVPRFSARGFLDSARRHGATEFNAIGAMLEILMRQPPRINDADTDLRLGYTGPSPTREWQEAFEARFGLRIVCGYAMSESPYGLIWRRGTRPFGTLGAPRQHPVLGTVNEARVIGDDGTDLGVGNTGELLLRNPTITPGYWQMPEQTAAAVVDGWMHTGDLVTADDDGNYTFVGRKKEVLRRRGQILSPLEVEDAITTHPDVLEAAVVSVPSELSEDEVKAFLVPTPGATLDFEAIRAWTAERLSAFKVPRFWQAVDELPRTPTSRVAKHQLATGRSSEEYDAERPA